MINQQQKTHIFRKTDIEKKFVNYFDKFLLSITCLAILLIHAIHKSTSVSKIIVLLFFIIILSYLFAVFHRRFAYKIVFHPETDEVVFHMYRDSGIFSRKISDISKVHLNMYATFVFNDVRIKYNDVRNDKLISLLNGITKVSWGFWGRLLWRVNW